MAVMMRRSSLTFRGGEVAQRSGRTSAEARAPGADLGRIDRADSIQPLRRPFLREIERL